MTTFDYPKIAEEFIEAQEPIGDVLATDFWQMKAWEKGVKDFAKYLMENFEIKEKKK